MKFTLVAAISILLFAGVASADRDWDALDVVDGPNPTLRYGFYTDMTGRVQMGRYYFLDDGHQLRVRLAPYGRTPVELPVRAYDRSAGSLELGWEGRSDRTCRLHRENVKLFLGNCVENFVVMPIAIRVANEHDAEWIGADFAVSHDDIKILEAAQRIMAAQGKRNLEGDRNCDDDIAANHFSVFCALYAASIEVAGVYRHRRPAMRAARDELERRYPGDYAHRLRDINNNQDIADETLMAALEAARVRLASELARESAQQ